MPLVRAGKLASWMVGVALGVAATGMAAEVPPEVARPTREELLQEIRRLETEMRELQGQIDRLRQSLPPVASAVVTVPAGARQGTSFNLPDPWFGPSEWVPSWPPLRSPSPQARERKPTELGALPPPLEGPLEYPQFVPGTRVVQHGLGPSEVTVALTVLSPDGTAAPQADPNRIFTRIPSPPDGTFTIFNYTERPITVRWMAQLPAP